MAVAYRSGSTAGNSSGGNADHHQTVRRGGWGYSHRGMLQRNQRHGLDSTGGLGAVGDRSS